MVCQLDYKATLWNRIGGLLVLTLSWQCALTAKDQEQHQQAEGSDPPTLLSYGVQGPALDCTAQEVDVLE